MAEAVGGIEGDLFDRWISPPVGRETLPIDVDPLNISFPARLAPKRSYSSEEGFLREFYKAERITITYSVQSG